MLNVISLMMDDMNVKEIFVMSLCIFVVVVFFVIEFLFGGFCLLFVLRLL